MAKPKVSIVTISYNQESYIRQTLDSFLMQNTNFDFEVIVADDASKDKTAKIIDEYHKLYPKIIKPILRKKNIGAQRNSIGALRAATGTYIALCEGDDYWIDPEKLQRQVDFMDAHSDYALCFHPVRVEFENNAGKDFIFPDRTEIKSLSVEQLLRQNFIQTNSVMYRRKSYAHIPDDILPLDWYLHLYHAQYGKIGFIDSVMSVYRRHPGGLWWDSYKSIDNIWQKHGVAHLTLYAEFLKLYGDRKTFEEIIDAAIDGLITTLVRVDRRYGSDIVLEATEKLPETISASIARRTYIQDNTDKKLANISSENGVLRDSVTERQQVIDRLQQELDLMKASRIWKLRTRIMKTLGKIDDLLR